MRMTDAQFEQELKNHIGRFVHEGSCDPYVLMIALSDNLAHVLAGVFRAKRLLPDEIERELDYFCETIRAATWMAIREADASPPEERSAHDAPGMATPHHRLYGP